MDKSNAKSELDFLIPPEIKNDEFYSAIEKIAREGNIKTVLEIGSSSGEGSTEALVRGLFDNPNQPQLFCLEISKTRFKALQKRYESYYFVHCYNLSSVSLEAYPEEQEIVDFYQQVPSNLNYYELDRILGWLRQGIEYTKNHDIQGQGIEKIKQEYGINYFDLVLIDGSEFTGNAELDEVYGAKYICLDDINTFKNHGNFKRLAKDSNYQFIAGNSKVRNGYAIFTKETFSLFKQEEAELSQEKIYQPFIAKKSEFQFNTELSEQLLVQKLVQPGMVVFDVGANVGEYSLFFSQLVGNLGKVYAFEPISDTLQELKKTIAQYSLQNIQTFQNAVFSQNQEVEVNKFPKDYSAWNSLGRPQMLDPQGSGNYVPIVDTEIVQAITLDTFCEENNISKIDYLKIDVEGAEHDVLLGTTKILEKKAIKFIQFEVSQKMLEGLNRKAKASFDLLSKYNYECHKIQSNGDIGEIVKDSNSFYENYIAFPSLPIHFFTIVLNGKPFIDYHIEVFKNLPFQWHWHIIEGVADLKYDTAWTLQLGGRITEEIHLNGLSNDGTTEYLDELIKQYPNNITIYRQPNGQFWDGKREMVNAPLTNINEECLLWQVDVDELWTLEQLCTAQRLFIQNPDKTAAFYWCWYFVGEDLLVSSRNCYSQNPQQEWLRTWRYKPGDFWLKHEPPVLAKPTSEGKWENVATINPFSHQETEEKGLLFQHFAYVTPQQLQFKEKYYGYKNAYLQWQDLQKQTKFPLRLRQYFPWVTDLTTVDKASSCGVSPIAQKLKDKDNEEWHFLDALGQSSWQLPKASPLIIVDGVFFQLYKTGIARVWKSLLSVWAENGFAQNIVVLDRAGTAPDIAGINYRIAPAYSYQDTEADKEILQKICDEEGADIFISTYYTTPLSTPSVFMAYDMIPEVLGANFKEPMWREKHKGIKHASSYISISENTAVDLAKCFPNISLESITVAHCGVDSNFSLASSVEISSFKAKYGINKPYFMAVGIASSYKNANLFFEAFNQLNTRQGFDIVCTGSGGFLPPELRDLTLGTTVHMLQLRDEELRLAYSGAVALVYPSRYEGFGLPIVEAMACGCPVITCSNASIPEVAGEAAIYVDANSIEGMANALCEVQKPSIRNSLINQGIEQAKNFSWSKMANKVSSALIDATLLPLNLNKINLIIFPDWFQPEEELASELIEILKAIAVHPENNNITLLIYVEDSYEENANLLLSGIAMNLLMEEDLDISNGAGIVPVGKLGSLQWQALLPSLKAKIALKQESQVVILQEEIAQIPNWKIEEFTKLIKK